MKQNQQTRKLLGILCGAGSLAALAPVASAQFIGPSTTSAPYVVPSGGGSGLVNFTSVRAVEDGTSQSLPQMVGLPDGLGAYDNGNGTFTILMNHELGATVGAVRGHGARGAFVSSWVIDKTTLQVKSITDLVSSVKTWNGTQHVTPASPVAFNRLCSADLPAQSAFQFGSLGTSARIFMNGEESGAQGRAFGHVVTGPEAGTSYELPHLGKFSWENSIANPFGQTKTIVAGTDDSGGGQVYFYVGNKQSTGNEVEKAGLVGGSLFGLKLEGINSEANSTVIPDGLKFSLADLGDVSSKTGAQLQTASIGGVTTGFQRPEDGAWNPANPSQFLFVTTAAAGAADRSRLWSLTFDDISDPSKGGVVDLLLDGTEGQVMFDNMTISPDGKKVFIQEDPGGNNRLAKVWEYNMATDALMEVGQSNPLLFSQSSSQGGFKFDRDDESSGIIPLWEILGPGYYALVEQAHTAANGTTFPGAVEHGQLLIMQDTNFSAVPEISSAGVIMAGIGGVAGLWFRRRTVKV